jgi:hypothetical protein
MELWCAKIPSGSQLTEMLALILFGFPALENPRSQPRLAENTSQPD